MIPDKELDRALLTLKIIWFAMLMSLGIYLILGSLVAGGTGLVMNEDLYAKLTMILYAVALVTLVATRYVRRLLLSRRGEGAQGAGAFRHPALQRYATATVVSLAMSESIGIYGLVLYLLGRNETDLYVLIAVSAVAMFIYRPRRDEIVGLDARESDVLEAWAREAEAERRASSVRREKDGK